MSADTARAERPSTAVAIAGKPGSAGLDNGPGSAGDPGSAPLPVWDTGITKVVVLASVLLAFSMLLIGLLEYTITQKQVVLKLKNRDLPTMAQSIADRVDAKINQAVETSEVLAHDPALLKWVAQGETDPKLGDEVFRKLKYLNVQLGYSTTFVASARTHRYWTQSGTSIHTLSRGDPADKWFFQSLASGREVAVNFDYNETLKQSYAFINTLAGPVSSPTAVVGVGMSLQQLSSDFAAYKDTPGSRLWLIDNQGKIYLSDRFGDYGKNVREVMAPAAWPQVLGDTGRQERVMAYRSDGRLMDLISYPLKSTQLHLLVQVERTQTVGFLRTILWYTLAASAVAIIAIILFFFYASRRLANPYQQAVRLNQMLEAQVAERTRELSERNEEILDSINYAQLLQASVLPERERLNALFAEHFVIWRPRDVVGGDFYWARRVGDRTVVAVGDCTGHGVPGAFMTLLAVSALERLATEREVRDPAAILGQLNRLLKELLHQEDREGPTDDGLDIALCVLEADRLTFAGAASSLYRLDDQGLRICRGDRRPIAYRRTPADYRYTNHLMAGSARYYLTSDGFCDQNGGARDYSFGKRRFAELIQSCGEDPMERQKERFLDSLDAYRKGTPQRDDIAVLAFRVEGPPGTGGKVGGSE